MGKRSIKMNQNSYPLSAIVGIMVGSVLPEGNIQEFDTALENLCGESVKGSHISRIDMRRMLRANAKASLKKKLPELAKACKGVHSYDPMWYRDLVVRFGESIALRSI